MKILRFATSGALLIALAAEAAARPAGPLRRKVCEGEISTGSGMAGTIVGECGLQADTDPERTAQGACPSGSICRVEALIDRNGDVVKVVTARQVRMPVARTESYLERLAGRIDGILAPATAGCDNPQDTPEDRVSVLMAGLSGATIQLHGRYCAVTSATGDQELGGPFEAVLRANCGPVDSPDADLRTGRTGTKSTITISNPASGPIRIDGEPLVRCQIRKSYTAKWWIDNNYTFRGRYP